MKATSVMIVENNPDLRTTLRNAFEAHGYATWTFPSPEIAVCIFSTVQPTVIVLDLDVLGERAYEMIEACKVLCPNSSVIVECNTGDTAQGKKAVEHGAQAFIVKSHSLAPLFEILENTVSADPDADDSIAKSA
jgi:DNA-binding NtrC family response regulator